jgi:cobalamin biosynthesis protein CobD/CbiB
MDHDPNPYSPPQSNQLATSLLLPNETSRDKDRKLAVVIFAFTVGLASVSSLIDDAIVQSQVGAWPVVFVSAVVAILSSFVTKDRVFAPMTCFGAIMCSCMVVSVTHSLAHAQLHLALPIAFAFSTPSLFIANWLGRK